MRILIIGGTSGIGFSVATGLRKRGYEVILTTHTFEEKEVLTEKVKDLNIDVYKMDVLDDNDLKLINRLSFDCIWVNHALGFSTAIMHSNLDEVKEVYDVNVFSYIKLLKIATNYFCDKNKKGKIIVTSSLSSLCNIDHFGIYASSKSALSEICYTFSKECKIYNYPISFILLELGTYRTGFNQLILNYAENECSKKYVNRLKLIFKIIEKKKFNDVENEIYRALNSDKRWILIRKPFLQSFFIKIYTIIFR